MKLAPCLCVIFVTACTSNNLGLGNSTPDLASATGAQDLAQPTDLASCHTDKLKLAGCNNDGSVEFCAPNALALTLVSMVPTLRCAAGGGRANCNTVGVLLCTYPTEVPRECVPSQGALTPVALQDLCSFASHAEVIEIVPTIFE